MPITEASSGSLARRSPSLGAFDWIALVLVIVGGLNWGLVGAFNVDLVATIFGVLTPVSRIVYLLVGVSALYLLYLSMRITRRY